MRVAVTGAAGYVGRFVVAELLAQGWEVRAWARDGTDRGGFPGPVEWVEGGLERPESALPLVEGADALVHAAYRHLPGRYRGGEGQDLEGYLAANLTGTLSFLRRARAAGVERVVFLSSRAVYGRRLPDRPLDEDHPAWPDSHYGAYKEYVPQSYPGRITLFRARIQPLFGAHLPDLGWGELAGQGVEVHEIPGDHRTFVQDPHVQVLAGRLAAVLRACE